MAKIDSRAKGATAERAVRNELRSLTGLQWERVPASGGLHEVHGLKGDLYVPNEKNLFCVEVKHYADDQVNTKILTGKSPIFYDWWAQTIREGKQVNRDPLLIFKHNRSKLFVATEIEPINCCKFMHIYDLDRAVCLYLLELKEWVIEENIKFILE